MPVDPICKKIVPEDTSYTTEYGGITYNFCSDWCKIKFEHLEKSVIRMKRAIPDK